MFYPECYQSLKCGTVIKNTKRVKVKAQWRVSTGSDSDWVLYSLATKTPVATALGSDKTKNPVAVDIS